MNLYALERVGPEKGDIWLPSALGQHGTNVSKWRPFQGNWSDGNAKKSSL